MVLQTDCETREPIEMRCVPSRAKIRPVPPADLLPHISLGLRSAPVPIFAELGSASPYFWASVFVRPAYSSRRSFDMTAYARNGFRSFSADGPNLTLFEGNR